MLSLLPDISFIFFKGQLKSHILCDKASHVPASSPELPEETSITTQLEMGEVGEVCALGSRREMPRLDSLVLPLLLGDLGQVPARPGLCVFLNKMRIIFLPFVIFMCQALYQSAHISFPKALKEGIILLF